MKKHLTNRVLSLLLVVAMLMSYVVVPAGAVGEDEFMADLSFTETSDFTAAVDEELAADETQMEAEYEADEVVRVSIVLEDKPTIEAGFSTMGIASNASAMAYRADLAETQADVTAKIETAIGDSLEVQWNLTLAANIISADVEYGKIAQIEAVDGVKEVVIELQYETCVEDTDEGVDPNTATSGEMIGSSAAYALGYTGAGSRIAIIDTGLDMDHQSFSEEGYEYSLSLLAAQNMMTLPQYKQTLNLLNAEEIASVLPETNAIKRTKTLTAEALCAEYKRLNEMYFGPDMVVDDEIAMEWARIPHFYYNYYVFQYATGYSAAIALSRRILAEGEPAVKDYLGFLSGGCSKSPIDLLKGAGVDMSSPAPVNQALELFGELLDEMEALMAE